MRNCSSSPGNTPLLLSPSCLRRPHDRHFPRRPTHLGPLSPLQHQPPPLALNPNPTSRLTHAATANHTHKLRKFPSSIQRFNDSTIPRFNQLHSNPQPLATSASSPIL